MPLYAVSEPATPPYGLIRADGIPPSNRANSSWPLPSGGWTFRLRLPGCEPEADATPRSYTRSGPSKIHTGPIGNTATRSPPSCAASGSNRTNSFTPFCPGADWTNPGGRIAKKGGCETLPNSLEPIQNKNPRPGLIQVGGCS